MKRISVRIKPKARTTICVSLVLTLGLVACHQPPGHSLTDNTCSPPCWDDIIPGISTLDEAPAALRSQTDIVAGTIEIQDNPLRSCPTSICWSFSDGSGGRIELADNSVCWIDVDSPGLSLAASIDLFGDPERYVLELPEGEDSLYWVVLINGKAGVARMLRGRPPIFGGGRFALRSWSSMFAVTYFDPTLLETLLRQWLPSSVLEKESGPYTQLLPPWPGYGEDVQGIKEVVK